MSDRRYRIVFSGGVLPGHEEAAVRAALGERFKLSAAQVERLFTGRTMVLKKDLDGREATRFEAALQAIGAAARAEPMGDAEPPAATVTAPDTPEQSTPDQSAPSRSAADPSAPAQAAPADGPAQATPAAASWTLDAAESRPPAFGSGAAARAPDLGFQTPSPPSGGPPPPPRGGGDDPYRPPSAAVLVEPDEPGRLHAPRRCGAGRGLGWVGGGWRLFRASPGTWMGVYVVFVILFMASNLVPLVGGLAAYLLYPVFMAGMMLGADRLQRGGELVLGDLFQGFNKNTGTLVGVGGVYLGGTLAVMLVGGGLSVAIVGGSLGVLEGAGEDVDPGMLVLPVTFVVLLIMALVMPLLMAIWFAPMLVALHDVALGRAISLSFSGCLRNLLPFLVYGLVLMVMFVLAVLPLLLGLLVAGPVFLASMYCSYREIYVD